MPEWCKNSCSPAAILADIKSPAFWRDVFLEGVGTTILVTSVMLVIITNNEEAYKPNTLHIGVSATLIVFVLIESFGPLCGAHLNPAVTIPLFIGGKITLSRTLAYVIIQIIAGLVSAGLGIAMTPEGSRGNFSAILPAASMRGWQSVTVEGFLTFVLLFAVMSVTDKRNHPVPQLPGLVVGSVVGLGALLAGTHSGGLLNPIVSLAPAVVAGNFDSHIVYWIGPILGGTIGVLLYSVAQYIKIRFPVQPDSQTDSNTKSCAHNCDEHAKDELLAKSTSSFKASDVI